MEPSTLETYQWSDRELRAVYAAVSAVSLDGSATTSAIIERAALAGDDISGVVARLSGDVVPSLLAGRDCDRLRALARRDDTREMLAKADQAVALGDFAAAREALLSIDAGDDAIKVQTSAEVAGAAIEALGNPRRGAALGIESLSQEVGQLPPGAVLTVGGYTGTGKSSLALLMAYRAQPMKIGLLSVEDPTETWGQRLLSLSCGVPAEAIQRRTLTKDQGELLREGISAVAGVNVAWCCGAGLDASTGVAIADKMAMNGAKLLIVDYLQAFRTPLSSQRYDAVSDLFKALKGVANRRECAMVVLSQLSRPERGGEYREPRLTQLKESGDIENESEAVMLLWQSGPNASDATLARLAKLKWGPRGAKYMLERRNGTISDMRRIYDKAPDLDPSSCADRSY